MDWVLIAFHTVCTACSLFWPCMYCHFSTQTSFRIASIGDIAYGANWYGYPPEVQKYLVMIIARSQEPIFFSGFGFIFCTMEVLLKVSVYCRRTLTFLIRIFIDFFLSFAIFSSIAFEGVLFLLFNIPNFVSVIGTLQTSIAEFDYYECVFLFIYLTVMGKI